MRINKLLFTLTSLGLFSGSLGIVNSTTSCKNTNEEEKNLMVANINEESWLMYTNYNVSPTIVPNINIYARLKSGSKWELLKNNTIYRFFAGQTVYFKGNNPDGLNSLTEGYKFLRNINLDWVKGSVNLSGDNFILNVYVDSFDRSKINELISKLDMAKEFSNKWGKTKITRNCVFVFPCTIIY